MSTPQRVTIDELVIERAPGDTTATVARELGRALVAVGVERADVVARAIVDDLDRRGALS